MSSKKFITAEQLMEDSFQLAAKIIKSGFVPDFIVGVWRGGTPVGIAVQELLDFCGIKTDHIAIRTSYYTGIGETTDHVQVHGLNYVTHKIRAQDSLLLVDDVFDTGASMQQIVARLGEECGTNFPNIRIATPYYKPNNNVTEIKPDYYLHETDQWLVFPHELHGLSLEEVTNEKPGISGIKSLLLEQLQKSV